MYSRDDWEDLLNSVAEDHAAMARKALAENADRDATIARLQAELVAKDDAWIADQRANAAEIIRLGDKLERLQARLDAGPSVEQLREEAQYCSTPYTRIALNALADRMEAANGK